MTEPQVEKQTAPLMLSIRIDALPDSMRSPSMSAVLDGVLTLLSVATVLAPHSLYVPTPRSRDTSFLHWNTDESFQLPLSPNNARLYLDTSPGRQPINKGEDTTWNGNDRILRYSPSASQVDFNSFADGVSSVGWLLDIRRLRYGSPLDLLVDAAIPTAVASMISAFVAWIAGGKNARKKAGAEASISEAAARLAESQHQPIVRESEARARIAEAEARLKEIAVEIEEQKHKSNMEMLAYERESEENLVDAYNALRAFRDLEKLHLWSDDDLAKIAVIRGVAEAIRFAQVAQIDLKVADL